MTLITPGSILWVFIAAILVLFVAPHLALISRGAARALKLGAAVLVLGVLLEFLGPMGLRELSHYDRDFDPRLVIVAVHSWVHTLFWGCLAWAVLAVVQSARPKGAV